MYKLKNWGCTPSLSSIISTAPPETWKIKLHGEVYNHHRFDDGSSITTSNIESANGKEITTVSGSVYYLDGPPDETYLKYLEGEGLSFDENEPVMLIKDGRSKPGKTDLD